MIRMNQKQLILDRNLIVHVTQHLFEHPCVRTIDTQRALTMSCLQTEARGFQGGMVTDQLTSECSAQGSRGVDIINQQIRPGYGGQSEEAFP